MLRKFIAHNSVRVLLPAGLLATIWFIHVYLSKLGDPLGPKFDIALWLAASCLKLAVLASLLWLLYRVHSVLSANRTLAVLAFATWTLAAVLVLGMLAVSRHWWSQHLATGSAKFYFAGSTPHLAPYILKHRESALLALSGGIVFACEAALLGLLAGVQSTVAFYLGKKPGLSVFIACIACEVLLGGYVAWSPWFLSDYDFFHGDIVAAPLLLDQVAVLASDPCTTLTIPMYIALIVSDVFILTAARSRKPA